MATAAIEVSQRSRNHQICAALVLSIVLLLTHDVDGRHVAVGGGVYGGVGGVASQVLLTELLNSANDNGLYNDLEQKYRERQPNYLAKWPALRDLLLTANDYEDDNNISESNYEAKNARFFQRLQQLTDNSAAGDLIEDARDGGADNDSSASRSSSNVHNLTPNAVAVAAKTFKDHGTKKNAQFRKQYMSPCHFKICNMGRKRNAFIFGDY